MNLVYIPLGLDCSVAFQLQNHNLRHFSLPFDWSYSKSLLDIIELITNDFSNFLPENNSIESLNKLYDIIEIKTNNFTINRPSQPMPPVELVKSDESVKSDKLVKPIKYKHIYSKYKLKHKFYDIILPHEFIEINTDTIQLFINKYKRRINRFYELNKSNNKLIFIRLGLDCEIKQKHINSLIEALNAKFFNAINEIKFINSTELSKEIKTSDWTRSEYNWLNYFSLES